jgi:Leucine rich repeat
MMNSSPSDAFDPGTDYRRRRRNRLILCAGIVMGVLAIGSGLFVAFGTGKGKNKGITDVQAEALRTELASAMTEQGLDPKRLTIATAYQSKAMEWLLTNEDILSYDTSQKLQRFVLACFYYATNGIITLYTPKASGWLDSTGWLTDISECDWKGVQCSEKKKVNAISLENNGLTGAIPKELIFLQDHITSLDLTTNLLYMSGPEFDVFKSLARLETLLLDDNYLLTTDGLPLSFTTLTSLKKLRLSYNLFGGTITAKMVKSWPKLTHLEIESNFLEGSLPTTLGDLDQLVYLYVRRNSLVLNLDFLKPGKMVNLCKCLLFEMSESCQTSRSIY